MGGFAYVSSKGLGYGSSFYVCIPHQIPDSSIFLQDTVLALSKANPNPNPTPQPKLSPKLSVASPRSIPILKPVKTPNPRPAISSEELPSERQSTLSEQITSIPDLNTGTATTSTSIPVKDTTHKPFEKKRIVFAEVTIIRPKIICAG
jgi:hypothetical protein